MIGKLIPVVIVEAEDLHRPLCLLLTDASKPLREDLSDMSRGLIGSPILVACPIVQVRDIGRIRHIIIKLDHCVIRLSYGEGGEMLSVSLDSLLIDIDRELTLTYKLTGVYRRSISVDTLDARESLEQCAIILEVYALDAQALQGDTAIQQSTPVNEWASSELDAGHLAPICYHKS